MPEIEPCAGGVCSRSVSAGDGGGTPPSQYLGVWGVNPQIRVLTKQSTQIWNCWLFKLQQQQLYVLTRCTVEIPLTIKVKFPIPTFHD
jgi:hypothetical protein